MKFCKQNMSKERGRSFIAIMVTIAFVALALRIAVEQIIKINVAQNESNAQVVLKSISTALENYADDHLGAFPTDPSVLAESNPVYIDADYIPPFRIKGYSYVCSRLEATGYSCIATPIRCSLSGKMVYSITTGGLLVSEECIKKD